jgi:hypothetical protein
MTQVHTETAQKFMAELHATGVIQARASISAEVPPLTKAPEYNAALEKAFPDLKGFIDKSLYTEIQKPQAHPQVSMGQEGPFIWNPITFGGGVPVGGFSQITLFQNGAYTFTGHFHDSGFPSYNDALIWSFLSNRSRTLYVFRHSGHMAGTVESGSRDDNWTDQGPSPALAAGWDDLVSAGFSYRGDASVNLDVGSLLNTVKTAWGAVSTVIAII